MGGSLGGPIPRVSESISAFLVFVGGTTEHLGLRPTTSVAISRRFDDRATNIVSPFDPVHGAINSDSRRSHRCRALPAKRSTSTSASIRGSATGRSSRRPASRVGTCTRARALLAEARRDVRQSHRDGTRWVPRISKALGMSVVICRSKTSREPVDGGRCRSCAIRISTQTQRRCTRSSKTRPRDTPRTQPNRKPLRRNDIEDRDTFRFNV